MNDLREYACIACGHCGYACPPAHHRKSFSPRLFMEQHRQGRFGQLDLWSCMTCAACMEICPENVDFPAFLRTQRVERRKDSLPMRTHAGIIDTMRDLDATGKGAGRRNEWLTDDLLTNDGSEVALFVGCLPMLDIIFKDICPDLLAIPRSAVRLLNLIGVRPRLLREERCCGHDAYWLGDMPSFQRLARMNREAFARTGIKEIVTVCPECSHTLSVIYDQELGPGGIRVRHISQVMDEALEQGRLHLRHEDRLVTYQDPCRLGRHSGIYEGPRRLIDSVADLKEMPRHGPLSACCGSTCFAQCDEGTKSWQVARLKEARDTGAEGLITACPKCLIHLSCAQKDFGTHKDREKIPLKDLTMLLSEKTERI